MNFQERLLRAIPGGAHTYSRGFDQFPSNAPEILQRGAGAYVWGPDGERFLDYGMALRAVTLGYANQEVNESAIAQINNGNNLTRASMVELEAAELLINLIPSIDMVKFAKNGSNVTTAAIKLARAYTNRKIVCIPREHPFFSFDDWFIGTTQMPKGTLPEQHMNTMVFSYGNLASLEALFELYPNQIAAVMLEPATTSTPCPTNACEPLTASTRCESCPNKNENFLHKVDRLCKSNGTLLILDEMITGFRWSLSGASDYFGVKPDLITFGKAMANGFSLAVLGGRRDVMEFGNIVKPGVERTFLLSSTHGAEMSSLGALVKTIELYQRHNVCDHLWEYGSQLKVGINAVAKELGLENYFSLIGPPVALNFETRDKRGDLNLGLRTLFCQEMLKRGILMPWISPSLAHGDRELEETLKASKAALKIYGDAIDGELRDYLEGDPVKPVFRQFN